MVHASKYLYNGKDILIVQTIGQSQSNRKYKDYVYGTHIIVCHIEHQVIKLSLYWWEMICSIPCSITHGRDRGVIYSDRTKGETDDTRE